MLKVQNLYATFGNFSLKDITFTLPKNKHLALVGPTGAGKTSLMEIIAGVRKAQKGRIILDNRDITNTPPHKRNISMLYQKLSLFPNYTVKGNIEYPLRWIKEKGLSIETLIKDLKLEHLLNRRIHELSGGEKQRVALARALVIKPQILILDEPLSSIDVVTKEQVMTTIKYVQSNFNLSTIVITHSPMEAYVLSDYIGIIKDGKLLKFGEKEKIWSNPEIIWFARMSGVKNIIPIDQWKALCDINLPNQYTHIGIHPSSLQIGNEHGKTIQATVTEIVRYPHYTEVILKVDHITLIWETPLENIYKGDIINLSIDPKKILPLKEE